jgi:PAS domain S-box-containing protein
MAVEGSGDGGIDSSRDSTAGWRDDRFRLLVEGVRDYAIFMLDPQGRVLTWNAGAQHLKQYTAEEIVGRSFSIFYPEDARIRGFPERELEVATREGRFEDQGWRLRKDGSRFWANVVITALRDETGGLRGFGKVTRDLTEQRAVEDRLRESEARLRLLVDSVRDYAILMLEPDGKVATWNVGAEKIKGWTASEIIGRHFSVFYPPEDVASGKCEGELRAAAAFGRFEDEGWRVRKDGSRFWANVVIAAIRDAGVLLGFAKVTRDLTDRIKAEEERLRLGKAEEAVRMRDEFLSIASHELRTPLTSLQLQSSALNRTLAKGMPDEPALAKLVGRGRSIERQIDRMTKLVEDLLDVSRAAFRRLRFELEPVDLSEIVRRVVTRLTDDLASAGCALKLEIEDGLVGNWDASRLDQVVTNLLSNAIKYGHGKPIDVRAWREDRHARLEVRDYGIGIALEDQPRIFERFARAAPSSNYGGLGLGLWIVHLILEGLHGSITVESRPSHGATFRVTLPLEN